MTHRLAVYFVCPTSQARRLFVVDAPAEEITHHYLGIGDALRGGRHYPGVGLWGFREVDLATGQPGGPVDLVVDPAGIRTIRVEGEPTADTTTTQGDLLEDVA